MAFSAFLTFKAVVGSEFDVTDFLRPDYLLVTCNEREREAVKRGFEDVLKLDIAFDGVKAWWILNGNVRPLVAHFDSDRDRGARASAKVREVVRRTKPKVVVLVGICVGFNLERADRGSNLAPGDVVAFRNVFNAQLRDGAVRTLPTLHQSQRLVNALDNLKEKISLDPIESDEARVRNFAKPRIFCEYNAISTDGYIENDAKPILRHLTSYDPRTRVGDMETGDVGWHLLEDERREDYRVPELISIKAVADVIDLNEGGEVKDDELARARSHFGERAAANAVKTVRFLIEETRLDGRFLPKFAQGKALQATDFWTRQLHGVTPIDYSRISEEWVEAIRLYTGEVAPIFTVCRFSPSQLFKIVFEEMSPKDRRNFKRLIAEGDRSAAIDLFGLRAWNTLPHFKTFSNHASRSAREKNLRLLILDPVDHAKFETEVDDPKPVTPDDLASDVLLHLECFKKTNGNMPCRVANLQTLQTKCGAGVLLTDHSIFGEQLVFDYYEESSSLFVSELGHVDINNDGVHPGSKLLDFMMTENGKDICPLIEEFSQ